MAASELSRRHRSSADSFGVHKSFRFRENQLGNSSAGSVVSCNLACFTHDTWNLHWNHRPFDKKRCAGTENKMPSFGVWGPQEQILFPLPSTGVTITDEVYLPGIVFEGARDRPFSTSRFLLADKKTVRD